jgi:sialidase-1
LLIAKGGIESIVTRLSTVLLFVLAACAPVESDPYVAASDAPLAKPVHDSSVLFNGGGEGGYHSFRIPAITSTSNGTLIAFAEGRRNGPGDWGDIDVVFKRSTNNGATWSALKALASTGSGTWGNPTVVHDGQKGRVWLFMSWNDADKTKWSDIRAWGDRRVFSSFSDDDGATWSAPQDMSETLLPPNYKWDAIGPGVGIQTRVGTPGRLVIPALARNIYSDDHGATWKYALIPEGTDEGTIVERADGKLLRNDRPGSPAWDASKKRRTSVGTIEDGFAPWSSSDTLNDPKCQASTLRYNNDAPARLVFLNPNTTDKRCNMTVRVSYDDGASWPISRPLFAANSCDYAAITLARGGYSSMTKTADYAVGALIEINEDVHASASSSKSIEFHKFNVPWILNGQAEP